MLQKGGNRSIYIEINTSLIITVDNKRFTTLVEAWLKGNLNDGDIYRSELCTEMRKLELPFHP